MITDDAALLQLRGRRVLLLFSGGFDSTAVALMLRDAGLDLGLLQVEYLNRPESEHVAASEIALTLNASASLVSSIDLATVDESLRKGEHQGWIPFKNLVFLGLAAHFATCHSYDIRRLRNPRG